MRKCAKKIALKLYYYTVEKEDEVEEKQKIFWHIIVTLQKGKGD